MKTSKGSILVFVLVLSALMSFLVLGGWQIAWMNQKTINTYQESQLERHMLEAKMLEIEHKLYNGVPTLEATWIDFVPDTLSFGETQGVDYYRIQLQTSDGSGVLTTTQGIRRAP